MSNEIGTAVYFNETSNKGFGPQWKLLEGSNVYRILPPFGSLAAKGFWSYYNSAHWGYKSSNGKARPFLCVGSIDFKTKRVLVECPQCVLNLEHESEEKAERERLQRLGKTKDEIKKLLEPLSDRRKLFNVDRKHYLNVMRPDGQIGILKISNNAMKALRSEIKRLVNTGEYTDPIGISSGIWFDFYRIGMDRNTEIKVSPVMEVELINGKKAQFIKEAPLTEDILNRMKTECRDLNDMFKAITRDQIQLLVESEGDPETVDSIFGAPIVGLAQPKEAEDDSSEDEFDLVVSPVKMSKQLSEEEQLLARLEEIKKNKLTKPVELNLDDMDPDKFLETYKVNRT